jgi:hypothetical protein
MAEKGFVYILKDSHFKRGVKIGRAHDVDKRMRPMLTANPWLSVYVKVETSKWKELERAVHNVIKLVAKTKQVKNSEFYLIEPEKAKKIMLEFSSLFDKEDFTIYLEDGTIVNESKKKSKKDMFRDVNRAKPINFSTLGILHGEELVFVPTGLKVVVEDDKTIVYEGMKYSLSGFTKKFIPKSNNSGAYQGPKYFSYKGKLLVDLRKGDDGAILINEDGWNGKKQLAKLIARRGGNEGAYGGILQLFNRKRPCGKNSKWRKLILAAGMQFDEHDYIVDWSVAKRSF